MRVRCRQVAVCSWRSAVSRGSWMVVTWPGTDSVGCSWVWKRTSWPSAGEQRRTPAPARTPRHRNRHRRPGARQTGGLVSPDTGRSRPRARHRRAQLVGATARLALAPGRRAAARRAPAPLRHPGHRPRHRRPPASPLALPARQCRLPGRKRRPPVVPHRESPVRTGRRHDHRDHPSPDRPHLRRVRRRHRHHRRNRASPAIPTADQHHGHRRASRLDRCRGIGGRVRHTSCCAPTTDSNRTTQSP